jgi:hypothetical protein
LKHGILRLSAGGTKNRDLGNVPVVVENFEGVAQLLDGTPQNLEIPAAAVLLGQLGSSDQDFSNQIQVGIGLERFQEVIDPLGKCFIVNIEGRRKVINIGALTHRG